MKASIADVIVVIALFYLVLCVPGQIDYAVEMGKEINDVSVAAQSAIAIVALIIGIKLGGRDDDEYSNL